MDGKRLLRKKYFGTGEEFPPAIQATFTQVQGLPRVRLALLV